MKTAGLPTLWVYAENDSYFDPKLLRLMFEAYVKAGGQGGVGIWSAPVRAFLAPRR